MVAPLLVLLLFVPTVASVVGCFHGFAGRLQRSLRSGFMPVSDMRMCAAEWCIKAITYNAFDGGDEYGREGVTLRCAYTGGDRHMCNLANKTGCIHTTHFDGMKGNFSVCCCQEERCNEAQPDDFFYKHSPKLKRNIAMESAFSVLSVLLYVFT